MNAQAAAPQFDPFKELVIDALVGVGVPPLLGAELEKSGMAVYAGSRVDVGAVTGQLRSEKAYEWSRKALNACKLEDLQELYGSLKEKQHGR